MIRGVVFDMDGVLIEAKDWHYAALNRALRLFGHEISRHEHLTTFDGLPTKKKLEMLSVDRGLPQELHSFINEMKQIYTMELVHQLCRPRFTHEYALSRPKQAGMKLAVASNSVRNTVEVMMQKASLAGYLDAMLSNEDVSRAKPDPEIYLKSMTLLGLAPHETLIVEDNENGIRAARASGAHVLVVGSVDEVNLQAIQQRIAECNAQGDVAA
ncbi:HAD family hydrolase [Rhodovarius lipocyclicus]|uniref:HAD family hydrolase n=1 Tax=Rhodovarius lipocyclicus TaxID=268410 RepID=UPI00135BEFAB|nr:HAD family phosphatase [Rhodovarius lipocyclicus]